ncbi:DUF7108 domain-containing protein [Halorientalis salina]|uniref:DUF7108 domain-containing protein n=1 Tax=Halorientalis salina TaxID=2932266 RepID=UPI002022B623|nr:rnhA operon protein [Halorientalis salina]
MTEANSDHDDERGGEDRQSEERATDDETAADVPTEVVDEAERLTRLAREAVDDSEAEAYRDRRASLLADHGYRVRVREDDSRDVLVLHPQEWLDDGLVQVDQIDDVDRGIERPLSGPGEADDWAVVEEHNSEVVAEVEAEYGAVHGQNAAVFAEFMSNHYARAVESATDDEKEEFVTDYFRRNAWPSDEQREAIERSVEITIEVGRSLTGAAE